MKNTMKDAMNRLDRLVEAIKESEEDIEDQQDSLEAAEQWLKSFPQYFNSEIEYSIQKRVFTQSFTDENYLDRLKATDKDRKEKLILAIEGINKINRLAMSYGEKDIFETNGQLDARSGRDEELAINLAFQFSTHAFLDEIQQRGYNIEKDTQQQILDKMISEKDKFKTNVKNKDQWER